MGISIDEDDPNIILRRGKQFLTFPMGDFQQDVVEGELDKFKKYVRPVVKTTPKIERTTNPAGRTNDHVEWIVTSDTGEKRRFTSKKLAQEYYDICTKQSMAEVTGDKSFDNMMKNISKGAKKQATVDKREQRAQSQQQARTAFGSMFGGSDPADKLKIKEQHIMTGEEASPMIKPPANRFDTKEEAFVYARQHGGKVFRQRYIDPNSGMTSYSFVVKTETDEDSMAAAAHHPNGPIFKGYWKGTDSGPPKPGQGVGGCEESIEESRSLSVVSSSIPKARNFVAKNSAMAGKAGQHKDKKRAEKQGDVKHKKDLIPVTENFVTWATNQGDKFKNFATDPEIYESARQEYKKKVLEFRNDHSPVAWHQTYYGGLDEENQNEDLQPGEYYVWTVYFDDDSSKRVKVTFDNFDPYKYYAKQNKVVVNVDYNWSKHKN